MQYDYAMQYQNIDFNESLTIKNPLKIKKE